MQDYKKFYEDKLYPLQDGILQLMNKLATPFYLTGGTALSRAFFNHRYSDDLDFFVNANNYFLKDLKNVIDGIKKYCKSEKITFLTDKTIVTESFGQCFIEKDDTLLKIDFVNDIPERFGDTLRSKNFSVIDSLLNILSNKISALFRYEPKDIIDIWIIAKNTKFNWETIISQAKEKELGVEPVISADIILTFPKEKLELIRWKSKYDFEEIMNDLNTISKEIITGSDNSLSKSNIDIEDAKIII